MAVNPSNTSTLYIGTSVGVFKTTDGGLNWAQVFETNSNVDAFALSPSPPHSVYVATFFTQLYKSAADGSFGQAGSPGYIKALTVDPTNSSVVYAASFNLYKSTDGGTSWGGLFAYDESTVSSVNGIAVDPSKPSTLYVYSSGSAEPVRKSTDGGVSWKAASAGLPATGASGSYNVSALAIDPVNPSTLYASCYGAAGGGGGVYRSVDGGANWSLFGAPLASVNALALDLSGRTLYAGADDGLYKTATDAAAVTFSSDGFSANESAGTATITVTRAVGAGALNVNYSTSDGTASAGADYQTSSGSLTFGDGETSKTFKVTVLNDSLDEFDEAVRLTLTSADGSGAVLARASLVIADDDLPPSLKVSDVSAPEGDFDSTDFVFHITLSAPSAKTVTAHVDNASGTAVSGGGDLFAYGGPYVIEFAPGETDKAVTMSVRGDLDIEPDEYFFVNVTGVVNATAADPQGRGVILNDEPPPTISVDDVSITEGNTGEQEVAFIVSLSVETEQSVSFNYESAPGTATEDQDYARVSGADSFFPGVTRRAITVPVKGDTIAEPNETFSVKLSNADGAAIADAVGVCTIVDNDSTGAPRTFQFSATEYKVQESAGEATVTVTRSGDLSAPASVDYATHGSNNSRSASDRSDYTAAAGTLRFGAGEGVKTFNVLITDDAFAERDPQFGDEFIDLSLSNPTGGAALGVPQAAFITIVDNDTVTSAKNPVDASEFFVRQHYHDFLNREPDADGLAFWVNEIEKCGADAQCREVKRINVSAAFFLSIEFQETGYLVERLYKTAYGDATSPNVTGAVPVIRLGEFLTDTQEISRGVIVGQGDWQAQLEANKQSYALAFVKRARFTGAFPSSMTAGAFVDTLSRNAGLTFSQTERSRLVSALGATPSDPSKRAQVLRQVAEDTRLRQAEFNRAFVLMEYYGYMRRNPDDPQDADFRGWKFWLDKLNQFHGDYIKAEMVKAFISSDEYRHRFGQ